MISHFLALPVFVFSLAIGSPRLCVVYTRLPLPPLRLLVMEWVDSHSSFEKGVFFLYRICVIFRLGSDLRKKEG